MINPLPNTVRDYMAKIDHRDISKAYSDKDTEYYVLQKPLGKIPSGAIFYYDPLDNVRGSLAQGCLKLAWTEDGDCCGGFAGDTIVFHASFRNDKTMFQKSNFTIDAQKKKNGRSAIIDKVIDLLAELKESL